MWGALFNFAHVTLRSSAKEKTTNKINNWFTTIYPNSGIMVNGQWLRYIPSMCIVSKMNGSENKAHISNVFRLKNAIFVQIFIRLVIEYVIFKRQRKKNLNYFLLFKECFQHYMIWYCISC